MTASVDTKIWRDPALGHAELLRGRFSGYAYDVHTHGTACFALITDGAIRIRMRGGEFVARAGDVYAIDAEEPHAGWPIDGEGWRLRTLYVDGAELGGLVGRPGLAPALAGPIIRDPVLAHLLQAVHAGSETEAPLLARDGRYLDFVTRLFARHVREPAPLAAAGREPRAVQLARRFLDQRLDRHVSLAQIAQAAGLPPFRLYRAFARAVGMSPHAYQRQARVRAAARLIRQGRPLGDVAAATGFADQAHLTRSFRRTLGVTPGAYRSAYLDR
ncbi:transcriptional regulator [Chelatococcus reniformis]|uniref:Transcriptional regulator n=1 Tax=Chelatococcus reniformis TaxID=1494448 RepID=A0A916XNT8_9HYPH|nr:transcriptional regulator [Chelatococcus reniformis]